jgi:orotidine-5'-phosphate decarboxylase
MQAKDRIFVSIDVDTLDEAKQLLDQCVGLVTNIKLGLQLATSESWAACIEAAHRRGFKVFCDAKFKDIPNTMERAAAALTRHQPDYFTIMADNDMEALRAVRSGVDSAAGETKPKIIGVTVLTSISPEESQQIYGAEPHVKVQQFGANAVAAGLDAIVCSPEEVHTFRQDPRFLNTLLITPGVRPAWAAINDQTRSATPAEAIKAGADMLVIGRPITQPPPEVGSVEEAIKRIITEIEEAT